MKIEVGKTYRTRGGKIARITAPGDMGASFQGIDPERAALYEFKGTVENYPHELDWRGDGVFDFESDNSPMDLVEEITDPLTAPVDFAKYGASPVDDVLRDRARLLGETASIARPQTASGISAELDAAQQHQRSEQRILDAEAGIRSLRKSAIYQAAATCLLVIAIIIIGTRTANARDLAWMPNDAGGEIVLTDERSQDCNEAHVIFARAVTGRTLVGCYAYTESGYVVARFGTDVRTWRLSDFRLFETPTSRPAVREFGL